MEAKDKREKNNEAATTTTTSSPLPKSEVNKIEKLKKSIKDSNPKKSDVIGQINVHTPNKSNVTGQTDQRSTTWTLLLYQDSAPENWKDKLKELHVPFIASPLSARLKDTIFWTAIRKPQSTIT